MRIIAVGALLIAIWSLCPSASAQTLTLTNSVPPVRMTYNGLAHIIEQARDLISKSNASYSSPYEHRYEWLDVADSQATLRLTTDFSAASFDLAPSVAYRVHYVFQFTGAPVSGVDLTLSDSSRNITVAGSSRTSVEAISTLLSADLDGYRTMVAGPAFRTGSGWLMYLIAELLILLPIMAPLKKKEKFALALMGCLIGAFVLLLPWQDWFAGTAVYAGDSSFAVRHSAQISLLGTSLTVAALVFAASKTFIRRIIGPGAARKEVTDEPKV